MTSSPITPSHGLTITIMPFEPVAPPPLSYRGATSTPTQKPTLLQKLISIRVVLVVITLITVISLGIGLVVLSVQAQNSIVNTLSHKIQEGVTEEITGEITNLFNWADSEPLASRLFYQTIPSLTVPPNGTNIFVPWKSLAEYMWSIVRKHPVGAEVEFDFMDGRMIGVESFENSADIYWVDYVNESLYEYGWPADLDQTIGAINLSESNLIYEFPFGPNRYSWIDDPTKNYLTSCDSPPIWFDLWLYIGSVANYYIISDYITICDSNNNMMGFLAVSLGLSSVTNLLQSITTDDVEGKIFIMDSTLQLVASSTNTSIFHIYEDGTYDRNTIFNTDERWIQQTVHSMKGYYLEQSKTVTINNTNFYLTVTHWSDFSGIDWYLVKLLNEKQFLGNSHEFYTKSIIAAVFVSVAALIIILIVTWATTKPLFILASDLQRMSHLDLDVSDMSTPRLFEVGRLYHSVVSMYIALRSFKKFVPAQVISRIIRSKKEVMPELASAKITIVFQDIEGFTSLAESMDPMTLAKLTSEYMEIMTGIIVRHGGTIDKYVGDCIMSLFNAPDEVPNHPQAATLAATECMKALIRKNADWKMKYGCEMQCRIGINTGEVLIGNMGSEHRMNYTAFGDNVNIASRLEGVNKHFGTRIMISKSVFSTLTKGQFLTRKLAKVRVSGKSRPTSIFEVRGEATAEIRSMFQHYESALRYFKLKDFVAASDEIKKALEISFDDKASQKLKERINAAIGASPLPPDWTYVEDILKL